MIGPSVFQASQVIPIHSQTKQPTSLKQCFWICNMQMNHLGNLVCRPGDSVLSKALSGNILVWGPHFWECAWLQSHFYKSHLWAVFSEFVCKYVCGADSLREEARDNHRVLLKILCCPQQESTACSSYAFVVSVTQSCPTLLESPIKKKNPLRKCLGR